MNIGKTLFAQLMDFLPWSTFTRIVARYGGDARVRTLCCAEQYRAMAFAQLTYRESLRDIEVCLSAQASKLYHMGFREPVRRSTLADANETRDWRIYAEFAHRLIAQARKLYANESLGLELSNTVYALDSTTIDLCLSLFPWAHFRSTKAAVKMHTLLDLRGNIPSFIHISDGKLHDVHALDLLLPEPGAIYVMDRGYVDFARLYILHQAGAFFVTRAKSNLDAHRVYSAPTDREAGIIADQTIVLDGYATSKDYPVHLRRVRFKDPESGKTLVFLSNQFAFPAASICALYKCRWQVGVSSQRARCHVGESPTEAKRLRLRSKGGAVARKQDGGALRQHARKECARSIRLQRTVNAYVASLHVLYPVAETVDNARRQQGSTKGVRSGGPHRRGISGDMMRTTACQLERPSTPGGRNPAEETLPITVSGKWKRRRQGVGSGQTVLLMGVQQNAPGGKGPDQ